MPLQFRGLRRRALAEQQRAVALARSVAPEVEAPAALLAQIEAQRTARGAPVQRRLVLIGASATAVLAVAIGLTVFRSGQPKDCTMLSVTRERADGGQAWSGEKVLVGTIDVDQSS